MQKLTRLISCAVIAFSICLGLTSCAHKSGHKKPSDVVPVQSSAPTQQPDQEKGAVKTKVSMRKEGGVFLVPVTVNGIKLDFVFDTGAAMISISKYEVGVMLRQGTISKEDVIGKESFYDATGGVTEKQVVLLRTVEIGGIELRDVEASVADNIEAPLLLGQTALSQFGKFSVDYKNNVIEFQ